MKNLLLILAFAYFSACAGKPESQEIPQIEEPKNVLENITFSLDTLVVDPGESPINMGNMSDFGKQNYSSVAPDANLLYLYDRRRFIVQEIDLNSLKLINTYPFEKEGPNGIGTMVSSIEALSSGDFLVKDILGGASIFSKSGEKIKKIKLNGDMLLQESKLEPRSIGTNLYVDLSYGRFYSLPINYTTREMVFAVLDSIGQTGKIYQIPEFARHFDFNISLNTGGGGASKREKLNLQKPNDLIILSSSFGGGVYVYEPKIDSLYFKDFPNELTPLAKDVELKSEVFSQKEYQAELDKLHTQIDYFTFYWDELTQRYYRFARLGLPIANVDSPKRSEYFMFAYDKNLELKGETKLSGISEIPESGFFKDGKFWTIVNVEDELGFAVMDFKF